MSAMNKAVPRLSAVKTIAATKPKPSRPPSHPHHGIAAAAAHVGMRSPATSAAKIEIISVTSDITATDQNGVPNPLRSAVFVPASTALKVPAKSAIKTNTGFMRGQRPAAAFDTVGCTRVR